MSAPSGRVAALAVVLQTVFMAVAFALLFGAFADEDPLDGTLGDFGRVLAIHLVNTGLVIGVVLMGLGGATLSGLGWGADRWRSVGLGVVGALVCAGLVAALAGVAEMSVQQRLLCATIGIGAGFVEETVFRGALQPRLVARLGAPLGIAATALIFSAYHLKFHPLGFVVKALFGCVFGGLREATGRNWAPAVAHAGVWMIVGFS